MSEGSGLHLVRKQCGLHKARFNNFSWSALPHCELAGNRGSVPRSEAQSRTSLRSQCCRSTRQEEGLVSSACYINVRSQDFVHHHVVFPLPNVCLVATAVAHAGLLALSRMG